LAQPRTRLRGLRPAPTAERLPSVDLSSPRIHTDFAVSDSCYRLVRRRSPPSGTPSSITVDRRLCWPSGLASVFPPPPGTKRMPSRASETRDFGAQPVVVAPQFPARIAATAVPLRSRASRLETHPMTARENSSTLRASSCRAACRTSASVRLEPSISAQRGPAMRRRFASQPYGSRGKLRARRQREPGGGATRAPAVTDRLATLDRVLGHRGKSSISHR